jgi:hypothetical protein
MLPDCIVDVVGVLVYQSSWEREACWQEGEEIFFSVDSDPVGSVYHWVSRTGSGRFQNCQKNCKMETFRNFIPGKAGGL